MSSNIDLDLCYELVMQLVNQAGEVNIESNLQTFLSLICDVSARCLTELTTENCPNKISSDGFCHRNRPASREASDGWDS